MTRQRAHEAYREADHHSGHRALRLDGVESAVAEQRQMMWPAQPLETFRQILAFPELRDSPRVSSDASKQSPIKSMSNRWRNDLTPAQQALPDDLLREHLRRLGYTNTERIRETVSR